MKITKKQLQEMIAKEAKKQLKEQADFDSVQEPADRHEIIDQLVSDYFSIEETLRELRLPQFIDDVLKQSKRYVKRVNKIEKALKKMTKLVERL